MIHRFLPLLALPMLLAACSTSTEIFYVAPSKAPCVGVSPMECLQVSRENGGAFDLFYDPIEDFSYEAGYAYKLKVKKEAVENPPADGSAFRWKLVKVIEKEAVETEMNSEIESTLWKLQAFGPGAPGRPARVMDSTELTLSFNAEKSTLGGSGGCNNYFASYQIEGATISISAPGSTMMYCDKPGVMDQEQQYMALLEKASTFSLEAGTLTVSCEGGYILVFVPKE